MKKQRGLVRNRYETLVSIRNERTRKEHRFKLAGKGEESDIKENEEYSSSLLSTTQSQPEIDATSPLKALYESITAKLNRVEEIKQQMGTLAKQRLKSFKEEATKELDRRIGALATEATESILRADREFQALRSSPAEGEQERNRGQPGAVAGLGDPRGHAHAAAAGEGVLRQGEGVRGGRPEPRGGAHAVAASADEGRGGGQRVRGDRPPARRGDQQAGGVHQRAHGAVQGDGQPGAGAGHAHRPHRLQHRPRRRQHAEGRGAAAQGRGAPDQPLRRQMHPNSGGRDHRVRSDHGLQIFVLILDHSSFHARLHERLLLLLVRLQRLLLRLRGLVEWFGSFVLQLWELLLRLDTFGFGFNVFRSDNLLLLLLFGIVLGLLFGLLFCSLFGIHFTRLLVGERAVLHAHQQLLGLLEQLVLLLHAGAEQLVDAHGVGQVALVGLHDLLGDRQRVVQQRLEGALLQLGLVHQLAVVVLDALAEHLRQVREHGLEVLLHARHDLALEQAVHGLLQAVAVDARQVLLAVHGRDLGLDRAQLLLNSPDAVNNRRDALVHDLLHGLQAAVAQLHLLDDCDRLSRLLQHILPAVLPAALARVVHLVVRERRLGSVHLLDLLLLVPGDGVQHTVLVDHLQGVDLEQLQLGAVALQLREHQQQCLLAQLLHADHFLRALPAAVDAPLFLGYGHGQVVPVERVPDVRLGLVEEGARLLGAVVGLCVEQGELVRLLHPRDHEQHVAHHDHLLELALVVNQINCLAVLGYYRYLVLFGQAHQIVLAVVPDPLDLRDHLLELDRVLALLVLARHGLGPFLDGAVIEGDVDVIVDEHSLQRRAPEVVLVVAHAGVAPQLQQVQLALGQHAHRVLAHRHVHQPLLLERLHAGGLDLAACLHQHDVHLVGLGDHHEVVGGRDVHAGDAVLVLGREVGERLVVQVAHGEAAALRLEHHGHELAVGGELRHGAGEPDLVLLHQCVHSVFNYYYYSSSPNVDNGEDTREEKGGDQQGGRPRGEHHRVRQGGGVAVQQGAVPQVQDQHRQGRGAAGHLLRRRHDQELPLEAPQLLLPDKGLHRRQAGAGRHPRLQRPERRAEAERGRARGEAGERRAGGEVGQEEEGRRQEQIHPRRGPRAVQGGRLHAGGARGVLRVPGGVRHDDAARAARHAAVQRAAQDGHQAGGAGARGRRLAAGLHPQVPALRARPPHLQPLLGLLHLQGLLRRGQRAVPPLRQEVQARRHREGRVRLTVIVINAPYQLPIFRSLVQSKSKIQSYFNNQNLRQYLSNLATKLFTTSNYQLAVAQLTISILRFVNQKQQ